VPEEQDRGRIEEAADSEVSPRIVTDLRVAEELLVGERRGDDRERGAVLRRDVVEIVRRNDAAAARHVARNDGGIAGNVSAEMARNQARIGVVGAARADRDDDRDGLAAVKVALVGRP
jgi:hypothetical protein